jgi:hypothetical protein
MTDPDLTLANPAVAAFMGERARTATPVQRRRAAVARIVVARWRPRTLIPRTCGCARLARPRARRTPRTARARPSDSDGSGPEPGLARPDLIGGAR